jgi:hypothetical protein
VKGGTASINANGDVLFTPDTNYRGVMGFKYSAASVSSAGVETFLQVNVTDSAGTVQSAPLRAAVYLDTADLTDANNRFDPSLNKQWYLQDANVIAAWGTKAEVNAGKGYSGKGVRIGMFEPSGPYAVEKEIFDYRHPDLAANVDAQFLSNPDDQPTQSAFSTHATMVAGVMVASRNGEGGVGVAYGAKLAGYQIGNTVSLTTGGTGIDFANLNRLSSFDIANNSWGFSSDLLAMSPRFTDAWFLDGVSNGRKGLGTAIVFAGGNSRANGSNTNYSDTTNNRMVITTGAINADNDIGSLIVGSKPFSNPGASILVAAAGSNIDSTSRELIGENGSTFGASSGNTQGTSFAAPLVSGVVALMLEANPNLGYRDIQTILAMSAKQFSDPNTVWEKNHAAQSSGWNGGAMHVSHDYGFGKVDALAANDVAYRIAA